MSPCVSWESWLITTPVFTFVIDKVSTIWILFPLLNLCCWWCLCIFMNVTSSVTLEIWLISRPVFTFLINPVSTVWILSPVFKWHNSFVRCLSPVVDSSNLQVFISKPSVSFLIDEVSGPWVLLHLVSRWLLKESKRFNRNRICTLGNLMISSEIEFNLILICNFSSINSS